MYISTALSYNELFQAKVGINNSSRAFLCSTFNNFGRRRLPLNKFNWVVMAVESHCLLIVPDGETCLFFSYRVSTDSKKVC